MLPGSHITQSRRTAGNGRSEVAAREQRIEHFQAKLMQKNEVIAALMEAIRFVSAIGDVTPGDKRNGLVDVIHNERGRKLEAARECRQLPQRVSADVVG